jgi:hypothetical protein
VCGPCDPAFECRYVAVKFLRPWGNPYDTDVIVGALPCAIMSHPGPPVPWCHTLTAGAVAACVGPVTRPSSVATCVPRVGTCTGKRNVITTETAEPSYFVFRNMKRASVVLVNMVV